MAMRRGLRYAKRLDARIRLVHERVDSPRDELPHGKANERAHPLPDARRWFSDDRRRIRLHHLRLHDRPHHFRVHGLHLLDPYRLLARRRQPLRYPG